MASKGKPSPRSSVTPLSREQVERLGREHHLVNPCTKHPCGPRKDNDAEIQAQNPRQTAMLRDLVKCDLRSHSRNYSWGLENVPETGPFITACTHITLYDVFIPMIGLFDQGRRPRFMAKAEMAHWPIVGWGLKTVGMQPVKRHSGQARAIEEESISIITSGRPLTVWPEGTLTRDPKKWPMTCKNGAAYIALESSRRLGYQVPLFPCVTWGAASINHLLPWPRKNVVMHYGDRLDYADLLEGSENWGEEPPSVNVEVLTNRIRAVLERDEAEIRGEEPPAEGVWDYRLMQRVPREYFPTTLEGVARRDELEARLRSTEDDGRDAGRAAAPAGDRTHDGRDKTRDKTKER
ncbi:acyl-phosphate glycerol 3-phosphate acyltransferase [Pseudoscardovia radai]|uniref:Acyl-phosphate glycerol 3-phosphate acyltransferase n=1 Tax=Pseudoscardovia radai TaxID=987066 RepID=A0A261EZW1_9BIFI|nr:acyl-phosphate glycerol 3-phosphate acyltransferase [Pseudoscardovia radai]